MLRLFALASGRSGTSYLADFFRQNIHQTYSTHEPYLQRKNPTLFGLPVYNNAVQNDAALLPVLERKSAFISACKHPVYFESNHALVKAAHRHMPILTGSDFGFVHLVRNPLRVAKSELLREQLIQRLPIPFTRYAVDGERYLRWALTGHESIFTHFSTVPLSRYQFYLLQWLEIEYRIQQIIEHQQARHKTFFIDVDRELKSPEKLQQMIAFFGLSARVPLQLALKSNKTPFVGATTVTEEDKAAFRQLLPLIPAAYLAVLQGADYQACEWVIEWLG